MGRRSSLHEDFVRVKTLMGLERFSVRFFFRAKFTKFNLALNPVCENRLKLARRVFMIFWTMWQTEFFGVKSLMGTPLDLKIFRRQKKFSYRFGEKKASKSKFASAQLKTYLNEKKQNLQFLWVKTVMGLEWFVVHFLKLLSIYLKVIPNWPKNRACITWWLLSDNFC